MKKVFVSSTIWDLVDVRAEIHDFLARNGFEPIMSEMDGFPDDLKQDGSYDKCKKALLDSDIFLMLINSRYGGPRDPESDEPSITHKEFRWAVDAKKDFICFIRDKVEDDLKIWKDSGRSDNANLGFVHGKNNRIFDLILEMQSAAPGGQALWWSTFHDSVDLKQKLSTKLGIRDYSTNYLAQAQALNALPRLVLEPKGGSRSGPKIECRLRVANIGSGAAEDVHIRLFAGSKVVSESSLGDILPEANCEWTANVSSCFESVTEGSLTYRNILLNVFESTFSLAIIPEPSPHAEIAKKYFGPPREATP